MASYFPLLNCVFIPFLTNCEYSYTNSYTNCEYYFLFFIFCRYAAGLNLNGKCILPYLDIFEQWNNFHYYHVSLILELEQETTILKEYCKPYLA